MIWKEHSECLQRLILTRTVGSQFPSNRNFSFTGFYFSGVISHSELKNALKELGKELTDGEDVLDYIWTLSTAAHLRICPTDEVSMLLLSVGAQSRLGMTFHQFIEFYDKQAAVAASENPSFEDTLETFMALGGR